MVIVKDDKLNDDTRRSVKIRHTHVVVLHAQV